MVIDGGVDFMPRQSPCTIRLSSGEAQELLRRAAKYTLPYFQVQRAKMILLAADGLSNDEIAARLDARREIVSMCCQGWMASACSQRHAVMSLMVATSPAWRTCRPRSATLQRDSGIPCVAGNSQARALTCTTRSGGETGGRPGRDRSSRPASRSSKKRLRLGLPGGPGCASRPGVRPL